MDGVPHHSCAVQVCCFFFSSRRRHTRLQGDWSSDVCSSDLLDIHVGVKAGGEPEVAVQQGAGGLVKVEGLPVRHGAESSARMALAATAGSRTPGIGRGAWRGRGENSGGAGSLKKKKRKLNKT